jgi:predicted nuclease of predicted toxin-antitoxin system
VILWIDAQLSPHLAPWLTNHFEVEAFSARRLGLRSAKDHEIFAKARAEGAVVMTKDSDFVALLEREGPPPQVLWITAGNTSNAHLRSLFDNTLKGALELIQQGEALVEISDKLTLV